MHIDRGQLKLEAKASLKGNWGKAIGIFLIYLAISLVLSGITNNVVPKTTILNSTGQFMYYYYTLPNSALIMAITLLVIVLMSPLIIGIISFFLKLSNNQPVKVSELFSKFNIFIKTAGLVLLISLKVFLWSLLFIIPGIIASLNYSQAYFIMAQNPDIGIIEAIELSKQMMKGEKGKLFVLGLSFIGWGLLAGLTFGLLLLWLWPYMMTTHANFYNVVSKKVTLRGQDNNPMNEFY